MKTTNWLTVIREKEVKARKLKAAQLCTVTGHCPEKKKKA